MDSSVVDLLGQIAEFFKSRNKTEVLKTIMASEGSYEFER
jgi:hypothetical protein